MNEILRSLIKWTEENGIVPEIYFTTKSGGIWIILTLRKHGKCMQHAFYVPGGVLCLQNWDMFPMEDEVNCFIDEAKNALLAKGVAE